MLPKARLDALTDGIFAFAMTLLVLDLRLPDDFVPKDSAALLAGLLVQSDHLVAYVISFMVLALRWLGQARVRSGPDEASGSYARLLLLYLFFITLMPFSTMVVGRYGNLAPAVWLYAANMIAASALGWGLAVVARREGRLVGALGSGVGSAMLVGAALLSALLSLIAPNWAMYAYFLMLLVPAARRIRGSARVESAAG
jgi:uncharacterized membrane protein